MSHHHTGATGDITILKQYVEDALVQWKYTWPLLMDSSDDTKIIYSVDTDVVVLFTNPFVPRARKRAYMQLFEDDTDEECVARGRVVAEFIFRSLQPNKPLLIIPPHTEELDILADKAAERANEEHFSVFQELRELKATFEEARNAQGEEELYKIIEHNAPRLVKLLAGATGDESALAGSSPSAEVRLFSTIFRDQLVAAPEFFIKRGIFEQSILSALAPPGSSFASDVDLFDLRQDWASKLEGSNKPSRNLERDVRALARIQLINQLLPKGVKLVHITGDPSVFEAGDLIPITPKSQRGMTHFTTFTECYLRHPRAFLAQPGILLIDEYSDDTGVKAAQRSGFDAPLHSEFSTWLIVFLARFWKQDSREIYKAIKNRASKEFDNRDESAIEQFCNGFPEVVSSFREQWDRFSRKLMLGHASMMTQHMPYLRHVSADLKLSFAAVEDRVHREIDRTWQATFWFATATSYGITRIAAESAEDSMRVRSIPLISSASFPELRSFIRRVIEAHSLMDLHGAQFSTMLDRIKSNDPSGYSYYLAYASFFAAESRWALARILAERSFRISETPTNELISGREAAYFCAVASRNCAKTIKDLDAAEAWVAKAKGCAADDRKRRPELTRCGQFRFDTERLSIDLARQFFRVFGGIPRTSHASKLRNTEEQFDILLQRLLEQSAQDRASSDEGIKHENWINANLERKILINLLMIALIRKFRYQEQFDKRQLEKVKGHYTRLSNFFQTDEQTSIQNYHLYHAIWILASLWIGEDGTPDTRAVQRSELSRLLSAISVKRYALMPYDKRRFAFFQEVASQLGRPEVR